MANLFIHDTGYANLTQEGTVETDIVNSGTPIEIKTVDVKYTKGANFDTSPNPGSYERAEANHVSVSNPKIILKGSFMRDNTADMDKITLLDQLPDTHGIKELYYGSTSDGYRDITDSLGATDAQNPTYKHLHIIVKGFDIGQKNSKKVDWTLTCERV